MSETMIEDQQQDIDDRNPAIREALLRLAMIYGVETVIDAMEQILLLTDLV